MEKLLAAGGDATDEPAPVPKSTVDLPELSTKLSDAINALFSDAGDRVFPRFSKTESLDGSKKFLPPSFPGPCRRTGSAGDAAFAQRGGKHMMTPLLGTNGHELKPKKDLSHAYRVATIAGSWQFKGLDADIDKALNLVWQGTLQVRSAHHILLFKRLTLPCMFTAWSITARAAMSLPRDPESCFLFRYDLADAFEEARDQIDSGDTTQLAGLLKEFPTQERALLVNCLEQRTTPEIVEQMNFDLAGLEQTIEALKTSRPTAAQSCGGEWDEERKRFLLEWMHGEEMV